VYGRELDAHIHKRFMVLCDRLTRLLKHELHRSLQQLHIQAASQQLPPSLLLRTLGPTLHST
jgi:hypothetical protein